tara:strand:+ start:3275 stop:3862 length:588 start_codon:yes stop_codon:yes gene_type:complete
LDNSTKLKEFRNAKGMTQQELATNSNISIRTIQRIEKGLSKGSSYSLKELAKILEIGNWKLLLDESNSLDVPEIDKIIKKFDVRLMNLSSLAIVVIPLSNFILPLILYIRAKGKVDEDAKKILSFQLLWSFFTILLMLLMPFLLLIVFDLAKPEIIFILVASYLLLVAINIFFVLNTARRLNLKKEILTFVPKII